MIGRALLPTAASLLLVVPAVAAQDLAGQPGAVALTVPRSGHTATLLESGDVVLAGGFDGTDETATVEVIDPEAGTVEAAGSLLQARSEHTATPLADGRILLAGGRADGSVLEGAELWDPASGTSEGTGALGSARTGHAAVLLADGRVLIVGGVNQAGKPVGRAEVYDPGTGTFADAGKPRSPHVGAAATLLQDGRVLVTGTTPKKKAKPAEVFVAAKDEWNPLKGTGERAAHTSTLLPDGRVLLAGGLVGQADYGVTQLFDPAGNSFTDAPPLSTPRSEHTATLLPDGRVVVLGGSDVGFEVAPIEIFDPVSGTFAEGGELGLPRDGHTATGLSDGRILVTGGSFATLVLDDVLLYDPSSQQVFPLTVGSAEVAVETRADLRQIHGAPDSFVLIFGDEAAERWTYHDEGLVYVLAGDQILVAEVATITPAEGAVSTPYDPEVFSSGMDLDQVLAATGISDYQHEAAGSVRGSDLYFADGISWGIVGGDLRFVMAGARARSADPAEVPE